MITLFFIKLNAILNAVTCRCDLHNRRATRAHASRHGPAVCFSVCRSPSVANQFTTAAFIARDFVLMKSSTKDKIKGGFEEVKGKVKEKAGKATGNPDLRDRGMAEKTGGKIQRKIGDVKKVFEQ